MKTYADLTQDSCYLIIETEHDSISLVEPIMSTENAVLLFHHDDVQTTFWRKKTDPIFEVVEELTEEQLEAYDELMEEMDEEEDEDDEMDGWLPETFEAEEAETATFEAAEQDEEADVHSK